MADSPSTPADLQVFLNEGARFIQALRPIWREVTRALPPGRGRKYFAFAVGIVGVAVAGAYIVSSVRRSAADVRRPELDDEQRPNSIAIP
jgi:hypothetical protein